MTNFCVMIWDTASGEAKLPRQSAGCCGVSSVKGVVGAGGCRRIGKPSADHWTERTVTCKTRYLLIVGNGHLPKGRPAHLLAFFRKPLEKMKEKMV